MPIRLSVLAILLALVLAACGGSSSDATPPPASSACARLQGSINQLALETTNCANLSDYRLFADQANPTANANGRGVPYDLTMPLFSDYTGKYRFVFVPEGSGAEYQPQDPFSFPIGTVITKTFTLPADTAVRGFAHETLLETRLLIRRSHGWVALPYVWNEDRSDAVLRIAGVNLQASLVHNGQQIDFIYQVPDTNKCRQCHQVKQGNQVLLLPIGPRASLLNRDFDYPAGADNQLSHWQAAGILTGVPADLHSIDTIPAFQDEDAYLLPVVSDAELLKLAKGYLDINCAHCHRAEGGASNTGLHLEYWRDFASEPSKHGVCKKPVAYGGGALSFDIVPGDATNSILWDRMQAVTPGDRMPEIGRAIAHQEGLQLIAAWINRMPSEPGCE